jgi:hypothetical protein
MNPVRIVDAPLIVHDCEVRPLPSRWPSEHVVLLCSKKITPIKLMLRVDAANPITCIGCIAARRFVR